MPFILACFIFLTSTLSYSASNDLPSLGDATSGLISIEQEHALGRAWLRNLRSQASTLHYAELTEYTENLIYKLASHSQVKDRRFEILLLDNKQLNAFAVPGGIIGINAGLFLHAKNEAQFAAVLAHELAHLSQRHFARQIDENRKQTPIALATLLGSIMLLATNNTEAGFAGLMTSQAAATQWSLSYSRDWEREADRLGMHTLISAKIDPHGMPDMFKQMFDAHKYSERPPEFLLTHPVTENRISDAAGRVDALDTKPLPEDIDYHLMRTRLQIKYNKQSHNLAFYLNRLNTQLNEEQEQITRYGLALILYDLKKFKQAYTHSQRLLDLDKNRISYQTLNDQILFGLNHTDQALKNVKEQLKLNPNNHPLTMTYTSMLMSLARYHDAADVLQSHVLIRKTDPYIWQQLAEAHGKAGNDVALYQARAEFLHLTGQKEKALQQLKTALNLSKGNFLLSARIEQRAREIEASTNDLTF
ncbi:M48 family metalloprotease [Oceaniserpentilla sp. 4NH20-0058]|uniref:M48 family metalloprotease n=1 Tax=Oceaniserpentilla sp. 4NH20-0058 TaxID=3127660 RepID=UPI00310633AC